LDKKALYALDEAGCVLCHSKNAKLPFYAKIPLINIPIKADISEGLKYFDITEAIGDIKLGKPVNETVLAKIEYAVKNGSMPPLAFKSVHWKSNVTENEKQVILEWVAEQRKKLNANSGIAPKFANEPVWPIPENLDVDLQKAKLGSILYHHKALSGDESVSCATCHPLDNAGVDALQTSTGIRKQKGNINAPTVFNAAFNVKQFWDGRAKNLEEQAGGPPLNSVEMDGGSWEEIAKRLSKDTSFANDFKKVYPQGFTKETITDAIAQFEKTLITPNSPFDKYLKGDENAISAEAKKGYEIFKAANCSVCHAGKNLGGQTFEYMGLVANYFNDRGNVGNINDKGLVSFTKDDRDTHKFKTPTLRNVAQTAPYFHDGSTKELDEAVDIMAKYQTGVKLTEEDKKNLVKFLESLSGTWQGKPLKK
ncbi:MAG: heme-binding domain-containing protein, partial [Opitutales bacterium]|nr:heme-binding domain-containing protein [Opitutales bacterium]